MLRLASVEKCSKISCIRNKSKPLHLKWDQKGAEKLLQNLPTFGRLHDSSHSMGGRGGRGEGGWREKRQLVREGRGEGGGMT